MPEGSWQRAGEISANDIKWLPVGSVVIEDGEMLLIN